MRAPTIGRQISRLPGTEIHIAKQAPRIAAKPTGPKAEQSSAIRARYTRTRCSRAADQFHRWSYLEPQTSRPRLRADPPDFKELNIRRVFALDGSFESIVTEDSTRVALHPPQVGAAKI